MQISGHADFIGRVYGSYPAERLCPGSAAIAVRNVRASSSWYQQLLGLDTLPEHPHREVYDRLQFGGELILQLHAWDKESHPNLVNADAAQPGHGVLLWFEGVSRY